MRSSVSTGDDSYKLIDKNPIYRTHDIFNGVFDKQVRLLVAEDNGASRTNCRGMIWLNFNQPVVRTIEEELGTDPDTGKINYRLDCDHMFQGAAGKSHPTGKNIPCFRCGSQKVYRTLEHEWSHIIFRSNPHLYLTFISKYIQQLHKEGYNSTGLAEFFHLIINAFDDIRVNSLLQCVYEGAAYDIWEKWRATCSDDPELANENIIGLIFAVALGVEVAQDGPFASLVPIIEEATRKVRGKGPSNMLIVVRWFMDRCIRQLLQKEQQSDDQGQQQAGGDPQGDDSGDSDGQDGGQSQQMQSPQGQPQQDDPQSGGDQQDQGQGDPQQQGQGSQGDDEDGQQGSQSVQPPQSFSKAMQRRQAGAPDPSQDPNAYPDAWQRYLQNHAQMHADQQQVKDKNHALQLLRQSAAPISNDEDHHLPDPSTEPDPDAQINAAAANYALDADVDDDQAVDNKIQTGHVDPDVQTAVDKLKNTVRQQSQDKSLLATAKANVLLVDVKPGDIKESSRISLDDIQNAAVQRMRSAFTKVMGRQQSKMDTDGLLIDVESVIQYMVDPSQDEVYEEEQINKGFAYLILCDMSGSMDGRPFNLVCQGAEMLKKALDYPFVEGFLWGFRGAINRQGIRNYSGKQFIQSVTKGGEIWLYRYARNCKGYEGETKVPKKGIIPICCDGLTPMNSAVHVALKYLDTSVPAGMAKRLFLLTDGNPTHVKTSGRSMSDKWLRTLVSKEIREGRQRGIDTFAFVIGNQRGISDKDALEMFGPRRFWDRVDGSNTIDKALIQVVTNNFVKYLKGV